MAKGVANRAFFCHDGMPNGQEKERTDGKIYSCGESVGIVYVTEHGCVGQTAYKRDGTALIDVAAKRKGTLVT